MRFAPILTGLAALVLLGGAAVAASPPPSREAAVLAERERQAEVDRQAEEEAARRERNRKHVKAINSTVAEHMLLNGAPSREVADQIVQGIAQGRIPYCSITY